MLFSSLTFLFGFLPISLAAYSLSRGKAKDLTLFLASLFFYAWGEPFYVLLMLLSILVNYLAAQRIDSERGRPAAKIWLWGALLFSLLSLGVLKYADFFLTNLASCGLPFKAIGLALPLGISFYTFQGISYIVDVYRGTVPAQRDFIRLGAYIAMFPQLVAGPIVRYKDLESELNHPLDRQPNYAEGLERFVVGLGKKVIIANTLGDSQSKLLALTQPASLTSWYLAIAFTLQIYYDFSAYSDMAIGLGKLLGFHLPENFNYPLIAKSITEFWRRWHISLGAWFRDYLYIPLGGNRVSRTRWVWNLFVVWFFTGLWHGAAWNFIFWGLYFFALLLLEKLLLKNYLAKAPTILKHIYVLFLVIVGFVLFKAENLATLSTDLQRLFFIDGLSLPSKAESFYLRQYLPLLIFSVLGAMPLPRQAVIRFFNSENIPFHLKEGLRTVAICLLFFLSVAFLVDGSFNPFLYFRF